MVKQMGYRSDVVIALRMEMIAEDLIKPIIPKAIKELGYTLHGNAIYYFIDSWKWYNSYPDIVEIEAFFHVLDERAPILIGKETFPWFGALRMGESDDDIETWGSPYDFDIYISRSIISPFRKELDMNAKRITAAPIGQYLYIDLPNGGYVQVKTEAEGVVVDIWSAEDSHLSTCIAMNDDIEDGELK